MTLDRGYNVYMEPKNHKIKGCISHIDAKFFTDVGLVQ
jgi:hypothetical protein